MKLKFCLLIVIIVFTSCINKSLVRNVPNSYDSDDYSQYCDFIDISEPFLFKIIDYCPAFCIGGGRQLSAANYIGITKKFDTVRVLAICHSDTTLQENQIVLVSPIKRPDYSGRIEHYALDENLILYTPDIFKRTFKTTFGSIEVMY